MVVSLQHLRKLLLSVCPRPIGVGGLLMKSNLFVLLIILCAPAAACLGVDDEGGGNVVQTDDTTAPDIKADTSRPPADTAAPTPDTDNSVTYCENGGWWCANGGTCAGRVCTVIPQDQRLAIRCTGPVQLTFWGSQFPGQSLWSGAANAGETVTGTVETTAITVETTGVSCDCFEGGVATGSAYHLPKGGWGCAK